ncbi:MAG: dienelactone hydrolase family protein [Ignavibacteriaceae bacterium]|nr:dienelactone hydrolase family protein [Ignavibacteriaceae bacterium]
MRKDFILITSNNEKLSLSTYGIDNLADAPCIIFVHGFKGFKDWGFIPYTAASLAGKGYFVITFNFSHNGVSIGSTDIDDFEKFSKNTISLEVSELKQVIKNYLEGYFGKNPSRKIGIVGHSRGGAITLLSSEDFEEVKALVLWASIAKLNRYTERQLLEWKEKGVIEVLNSRTNQLMKLGIELLNDIEKNLSTTLNLEQAIRNSKQKLLIAHGEQDLTVPLDEARMIFNWSNKSNSELFILPNTGHTFGIVHPFSGSNQYFDKLLNKTITFFNQNIN